MKRFVVDRGINTHTAQERLLDDIRELLYILIVLDQNVNTHTVEGIRRLQAFEAGRMEEDD